LSAALFLAWRGVPTVLIEKHADSSLHPRAIGYTPRTLELLRAVGLGERVPQAPASFNLRRARVESLAGTWLDESPWTPDELKPEELERSPCRGAAIAQDRLEPILRERARELGADIRLSTKLLGFQQTSDGVELRLQNAHGEEYALCADYVVAADGHRSPIREALGIGRSGRGHLRTLRSVMFRAPLESYLASGVSQFSIDQPDFKAFMTTYGDGRWVLMLPDDEERDAATLKALIYRAIGRDDLDVELITTGRWELSGLIADRFSEGRIFLAGDAAHTLPPNRGGFGANTGIEDAHNLAWKLQSVLSGVSKPALMETYDAERRPIAWLRHDQIFARTDYESELEKPAQDVTILDDAALEFGQLYRSSAVLGAGPELAPARRPEQWRGQPGTRAPHFRLAGEPRRSSLDLLQKSWVLLADDDAWESAAVEAEATLGIAMPCLRFGRELTSETNAELTHVYGLEPGGATLIRPDGYVAWRAPELPAHPAQALTDALRQVASI
jgi:2-polyprenyl-6-methoxyphenol hydroxylase-like FAD-dependent oxidoreductase